MLRNLNVLFLFFNLILFLCCKHEIKVDRGRELITQNLNILIDSVESFDTSKFPVSEEFKDVKVEKIKIGLIDSVVVQNMKEYNTSFLINRNDLVNFKSDYEIEIVKVNNYDINFLFVSFSNFKVDKDKASIDVKKVIGISMITDRYFFKNDNGHWVFIIKKNIGMG